MKPTNPLHKDLEAFNIELPSLQQQYPGKFALFIEAKLQGTFDTASDAFDQGYAKAGLKPFLVKQITAIPTVQHFTRMVGFKCLTSC